MKFIINILMFFIIRKKFNVSVKEYDEYISHIAKIYFNFTSLNIYVIQASKAVLSYSTSANYDKHSINIGEYGLFADSFIYGKRIYEIKRHSELSFIYAMKSEDAVIIPLKDKKQVFGIIMFLYKGKKKLLTLMDKINISVFTKITEQIFSCLLKNTISIQYKNHIVSEPLKIKEYKKYLNTENSKLAIEKHSLDYGTFIFIKYLREQYFSFKFENIDDVENIEKNILSLMEEYNFDNWDLSCIGTSLWEACNNALIHSGIKDTKEKADVFGYINSTEILISINDKGKGFNHKKIMKNNREDIIENIKNSKHNGMGIFLIKNCVDDVTYKAGGTIIEMRKKRSTNTVNLKIMMCYNQH